jgi:hypothetical protein
VKSVIITKDRVNSVIGEITKLVGKQVLVGIPERTTTREDDEGPITNAALGYIHEFGAPGANIPARPFLIPGVRKAQREATVQLKAACTAALDGNTVKSDRALTAAGLIAETSAKREIHTGNFVPLKPGTIRGRKYSRGTQSRRQSEERYAELIQQGLSPASAQEAVGIRPLINTGQLAASITSVVRKRG